MAQPTRRIPMMIRIHSVDPKTGECVDKVLGKSVDWNDKHDRIWLQNHLHWAFHHSINVSLSPESN